MKLVYYGDEPRKPDKNIASITTLYFNLEIIF